MPVQRHYILLLAIGIFITPFMSASANEMPDETMVVLSNIKHNAEGMVDAALEQDAKTLQKIGLEIQQDIAKLHDELEGQAFDERRSRELLMAYSWTRVISIDIRQKAWVGVAIAANQLSASMFRFTNYSSLRQRDIAWMGYLSRELLLLNMENPKLNAELLNIRRADLKSTWQRISRDLIENFHNKPYVIEGKHLMLKMDKTRKPTQVISLARKLLVFVNKIKKLQ